MASILCFTGGEDHWGPDISCIREESMYDQRCCFSAPRAPDWRGKGAVEITGTQLDLRSVCVLLSAPICASAYSTSVLRRNALSVILSSQQTVSAPPYSPVFLDGWQPQAYDSAGRLLVDPIQLQHKEDAFNESMQKQSQPEHVQPAPKNYREGTEKA